MQAPHDEKGNHLLSNVVLLKLFGQLLLFVLGKICSQISKHCWLCCEKWLPFGKQFHSLGITAIGLFGKLGIKCVLRANLCKNHAIIVCHACALMSYQAALYLEEDKKAILAGIIAMLKRRQQWKLPEGPSRPVEDIGCCFWLCWLSALFFVIFAISRLAAWSIDVMMFLHVILTFHLKEVKPHGQDRVSCLVGFLDFSFFFLPQINVLFLLYL